MKRNKLTYARDNIAIIGDGGQWFVVASDIISGMTAEIDIIDERSHVRFGKKWVPQLYKQRLGDNSSLEEIRSKRMRAFIDSDERNFGDLTEEEKDRLSHAAFCGKIEFKYLNFERP